MHTLCVCAKLFQSCRILCDLIDRSPPGYFVYEIFQARILNGLPFEHIIHTYKCFPGHSPFIFQRIFFWDACNFKDFTFYSLSSKAVLRDFKLEGNKRRFEF